MRSLVVNLKDKNNPDLRRSIVSGEVESSKLWNMTPQEMASAEKKAELQAFAKEALINAQGAAPKKSETDMFQCGKCRQRKCTYYQMQTRSADEVSLGFALHTADLMLTSIPYSADDYLCYLRGLWTQLEGNNVLLAQVVLAAYSCSFSSRKRFSIFDCFQDSPKKGLWPLFISACILDR